jgi:hypothetical protein
LLFTLYSIRVGNCIGLEHRRKRVRSGAAERRIRAMRETARLAGSLPIK